MKNKFLFSLLVLLAIGAILFFGSQNLIDLKTADIRAEATTAAARAEIAKNKAREQLAPTIVFVNEVEVPASQAEWNRAQASKANNDGFVALAVCVLFPLSLVFFFLLVFFMSRLKDSPMPFPVGDVRGGR